MGQYASRRRQSRVAVRAALGLSALALASLLPGRPAGAAGLWLPRDFGPNAPGVVVAIGDSITVGIFRDDCHNPDCIVDRPYTAVLQSLLQARHPGVVVRNRGLGGESTGGGLGRLPGILASDRPGFVLIMEGTNDAAGGEAPERIVANLRDMVRVVKASSSIPLVGAIPPNMRDDPEARSIVSQANAMLPGMAAEEGVRFVDIFGPLNNSSLYGSEDRLHPNQRGYEVMAATWLPALLDAIDASRSLLEGPALALSFDADGDGRADVAIFRADTGEWFARRSSDGTLAYQPWGAPLLGDRPVPGRYTGNSRADIAIYRPVTGEWFIRKAADGSLVHVPWGAPALDDIPVPADYDGDGTTDIAVFRRSTGEWFIRQASTGALLYQYWGAPSLGDVPVPADYDGDGAADVAVYRSLTAEWFIRKAADGTLIYVPWGCPTCRDRPVPGHYQATPAGARVAVYRPGTGQWFIRRGDGSLLLVAWGAPSLGDVPVPANYTDGSTGITDVAVYRTSTGEWFIRRNTDAGLTLVPWGAPVLGDVPVIGSPPLP
jgi:lysophospholipase L1-like esterase